MDDGFIPWLQFLDIKTFELILNNLDINIKFTIEASTTVSDENGSTFQSLNFLDINIILHPSGEVETDVYYKPTNTHEYLPYNSHHPQHIKANIPYNLAKRIMVFTSNPTKEQLNLNRLKCWLRNCGYPSNLIKKKFRCARLQGSANYKENHEILPILQHSAQIMILLKFRKNLKTF